MEMLVHRKRNAADLMMILSGDEEEEEDDAHHPLSSSSRTNNNNNSGHPHHHHDQHYKRRNNGTITSSSSSSTVQSQQPHDVSSSRFTTNKKNNCYQQAMNGQLKHSDGSVRSSWLNHVQWFSPNDTDGVIMTDDISRSYLKSQSLQLLNVKRRLWPTAVAIAEKQQNSSLLTSSPHEVFIQARQECNPFEKLGRTSSFRGRRFINRSAIKLANINAMIGFHLTTTTPNNNNTTFVDLCGAPGGFSEYLLSSGSYYGGIAMSLNGTNEHGVGLSWKLQGDSSSSSDDSSSSSFTICHGQDGTGDIYNWKNVLELQRMVKKKTGGIVQLVVADGGMDNQRNSEIQEETTTKLMICQVSAMMTVLDSGGTFMMKMFGFQTSTIRNLLYSLSTKYFQHVIVVKPISSRPASAERYVIWTGYKKDPTTTDVVAAKAAWNWRNEMFLGNATNNKQNSVLSYFDTMDHYLLELNLQACFSILTFMQRRQQQQQCHHNDEEELPMVDINAYQQEWGI